jgi:hypothetical protein
MKLFKKYSDFENKLSKLAKLIKMEQLFKQSAKNLEEKGYYKVKVNYTDGTSREFNIYEFDVFKNGLKGKGGIISMYNRELCEIEYKRYSKIKRLVRKIIKK